MAKKTINVKVYGIRNGKRVLAFRVNLPRKYVKRKTMTYEQYRELKIPGYTP